MKNSSSQQGHVHLAALLIAALAIIGAVGFGVYQNQSSKNLDGATTALSASTKAQKEAQKKAKLKKKGKGSIEVTTKELVVNKKTGKRKIVKRGNVVIVITSVNPKASCRDGGKNLPRSKSTGKVFGGKSDAKAGNRGKIKVDSCSIGTYTLRPVLSDNYEVLEGGGKFNLNPKQKKKLSITIASKVATPNGSSPGGSGPAQSGPGGVNPADGAPLPKQPANPTREECMQILKWYYVDNPDRETSERTDAAVQKCEELYPDLLPWIQSLLPPEPTEPDEPTPEDPDDPGLLPEDAIYGR